MNDTNKFYELCNQWRKTATDQEWALHDTIIDSEDEYFPDMTFKPDSIIAPYIEYEFMDDNGEMQKTYEDVPLWLDSITNMYYRFYVKDIDSGCMGEVNYTDRTLTISPKYINDTATILHEMIHVYENNINETMMFFHDILTLCLYNDLKAKIPNLDSRIIKHTHVITGATITMSGGEHDALFFLKSLDLDLRCGYKLGTVCGYGRDE